MHMVKSWISTLLDALTNEAPPTNGAGVDTSRIFFSTFTDSAKPDRIVIKSKKT